MDERRKLSKSDIALLLGGPVMAGTYYVFTKSVGDLIGSNEQGMKAYDPELLGPTAITLGVVLTGFGLYSYFKERRKN